MIIILETSCFLPLSGSGAVSEKKFRRRKSNKLEKNTKNNLEKNDPMQNVFKGWYA